jgi:hypothetical protein
MTTTPTRNPRALSPIAWGSAAGLLALPAIAMRIPGSGVHWTASDFLVMGALLALACGGWEFARRRARNAAMRAGYAVAVLGALVLVWANLAVGLVGDGANPANLMFMGVVAIAAAGALLARGRPARMRDAMLATAAAHALVGAVAAATGAGGAQDGTVLAVTAVFALPWLLSAALFHLAATRTQPR